MLDNASNNDTLVEGIQKRAQAEGIYINAIWARLRCMPHTVHLSAVKASSFMCMQVNDIDTNIFVSFSKQWGPYHRLKVKRLHQGAATTRIQQRHPWTVHSMTL